MSQPPEYPGRRRLTRAAGSVAGDAYQGAFEAVMAVLVGAGFGYWADGHWGTTPYGVVVGIVVGFAAMVIRLLRIGRELPQLAGESGASDESDWSSESDGSDGSRESGAGAADASRGADGDSVLNLGVSLGGDPEADEDPRRAD